MDATTEERVCPACGMPVYPGEGFCEACGHDLGTPVRRCTGCGANAIDDDGYCGQCGLRQPDGTDHVEIEIDGGGAGVSDKGLRHSRNEDAMALTATRDGVAAVVCDGVSSSSRPEEASRIAADTGAAALAEARAAGTDAEEATRAALLRAGDAAAGLAGGDGTTQPAGEPPSCTYVSALTHGRSVTVGWVGDSRAYWLPAEGEGARLTDDDSWAGQMVTSGAMTAAEAEAHPNAHVITGWLGADAPALEPHVRTLTPDGAGVVLVCSDGLWNYLPEAAELAAAVPAAASEPLEAARALTRLALDAGGRDNITVIVIPFPPSEHPTQEQSE